MKPWTWSSGFVSVRKLMTRQQIDNWIATMQSACVRHTQTCIAKPFQVVWSNWKSRESINYFIIFLHIIIKSSESPHHPTCAWKLVWYVHANNNQARGQPSIWSECYLFSLFLRINIKISPIFRPMWRNLSTFSNDSLNILIFPTLETPFLR